jgi:tetratricopeptide (TPR) repeat protein
VRAEQYLELAMQRGYDRRAVLPVLLSACVSSMHLRAALGHAESYLLEHPEDDGLRYLVATIRIGLGQRRDAELELERLIRRSPDNADAHFLLGLLHADDDVASAEEHLRRCLAVDPHGRRAAEARSRLSDLTASTGNEVLVESSRSSRSLHR